MRLTQISLLVAMSTGFVLHGQQAPKAEAIPPLVEQRAVDSSAFLAKFNEMYASFEDEGSLKRSAETAVTLPGILRVQFVLELSNGLLVTGAAKKGGHAPKGLTNGELRELLDRNLPPDAPKAQIVNGIVYGVCRINDPAKRSWVVITVESKRIISPDSVALLPNHSMHRTSPLRGASGDFES